LSALDKIKAYFGFKTSAAKQALAEVLQNFDIVSVNPGTDEHGPFIVVTEKGHRPSSKSGELSFVDPDPTPFGEIAALNEGYRELVGASTTSPVVSDRAAINLKESPDFREIGSSSPSPYTAGFMKREYNRDLEGLQGLSVYNKMRSDGVIAGTLLLFKTPVYAANWFMQPVSQDDIDKEIADFVWKCLTEYMSISWTQVKTEAMLMCEFGYYMFEKVWERRKIDGKSRIVLQKLAPRHPMDVKEWHFDNHGGPESVDIYRMQDQMMDDVPIPIKKLLVLTLNREANDITGRSMMRPMYKHWYFKEQLYKIDAIQKERHGIGIPVIKLPQGYDDAAKIAANELGRNLRTNERAHVVLPPGWEVLFAKLEGQPVDAIKSIEMHDKAIRESVLASFLSSDHATKEEDVGLFLKASRFVADSICDAFNLYLIPELVRYNFGADAKVPKLKVRRIGEQADWRVMAFAIRSLVGSGIIRPDDKLEERIREEMDLPVADVLTMRVVQTPQAAPAQPATTPNATPGGQPTAAIGKTDGTAGSTGLPRQTPVATPKLPGGNAGNDKGGQS
jgi:hypothetical protein